jgi:hypothetical protein
LLEILGWRWGKRYVCVKGKTKYLALYCVENMDVMSLVMGADSTLKDPRAVDERARFDAISEKYDVVSNVYEQISGAHLGKPFLKLDHYLSVVMADVVDTEQEAKWNSWYDHSHVPNLVQMPGYLSAARFRIKHDLRFGNKQMGPKYLALYEWEDAHCLDTLASPAQMLPQAELANWHAYGLPLTTNTAWNVYKPVASQTSFR